MEIAVNAVEIETIRNKLLIDFAKVRIFISIAKPIDPCVFLSIP